MDKVRYLDAWCKNASVKQKQLEQQVVSMRNSVVEKASGDVLLLLLKQASQLYETQQIAKTHQLIIDKALLVQTDEDFFEFLKWLSFQSNKITVKIGNGIVGKSRNSSTTSISVIELVAENTNEKIAALYRDIKSDFKEWLE